MEPLIVSFEQRRGHYMRIERKPSFLREELNYTQLQMLKQCEIPGLLPLETEENNGEISIKYLLTGKRMLSEALRITNWTMYEMMSALCRLGEILEECKLYLLDDDRIRLHDEYIFIGRDWEELYLTYLPIDMPTLHRREDLEHLIIRWMLKVKEPDGLVIQHVLRLVATKGFIPISLTRYARQYLADKHNITTPRDLSTQPTPTAVSAMERNLEEQQLELDRVDYKARTSKPWNIFQPPTGGPHTVSEMWGYAEELQSHGSANSFSQRTSPEEEGGISLNRWRMLLCSIALIGIGVAWRFLYLEERTEQKLLLCLCLSLISIAAVIYFWRAVPVRAKLQHTPQSDKPQLRNPPVLSLQKPEEKQPLSPETTWIGGSRDETTFLSPAAPLKETSSYLLWENQRIPLGDNGLVIGRSSEAATHLDTSMGISRAHAELVKISEQWSVKDLGSRNGSKLNDQLMTPYELYPLQSGDCLVLGSSQYYYHNE